MHTFENGKTRIRHNGDFSGDAMLTGKDSHVYIPCADLLAFADYARERMAEAKADRPAGMSEEEHAALVAFNAGRRAIGGSTWSVESWISGDVTRPEAVAFYRASRAPLEAENKTLREQLGKATEMNHRQAKDIGGLEGYLGKDGTAFLHTGTPATVEAVRRIEELKAQLAQAQKPAVKSLADMIAESTTLAMGQRTAALETMIREFISQTGAKVEDCVLVYQAEREKMTWRIEHRPKGEGGET